MVWMACVAALLAGDPPGQRRALVVGIDRYQHPALPVLKHA